MRRPPRPAAWLLERLIPGEQRDGILGDLDEQFAHGRSPLWFWQQTLTSIALLAFREIRSRKLVALWGLFLSVSVFYFVQIPMSELAGDVDRFVLLRAPKWVKQYSLHESWRMALSFVSYVAIGWIIANLDRQRRVASVMLFLAWLTLVFFWYAFQAAINATSYQWLARYLILNVTRLIVGICGTVIGSTTGVAPRSRTLKEIR